MNAATAARRSLRWSSAASAKLLPGCSIEVLIPDFKGSIEALKIVMDARPEILNHNVETVPRLFKTVQPQDNYEWAAATLSNAKNSTPMC
jgi:lipoyl synthase